MKENVLFDDQEKITLADDEVDAIEQYIDNSTPPEHVNLNNQYSENLVNMCNNYCAEQVSTYGFTDVIECIAVFEEKVQIIH